MKNIEQWRPSKYVYENGKLVASRDRKHVGESSRLIANIVAEYYDYYIKEYVKGKLVDLGCGDVPLYIAYKDYVKENICVDWENTIHPCVNIDYKLNLTNSLPFEDGEFDTIILSDVLEHVPDPDLLWREMSRILNKEGILIINVPFYYWLHETPNDFYRYTEYALRRFAGKNRFETLVLEPIGGAPEILTDIVAKLIKTVPVIGPGVSICIQKLTHVLIKTKLGGKLSDKTSRKFPLGYFMVTKKVE